MIPKKLHYCWFSGEPFPDEIQRCIDSWKKFLPDFEWIKWDAEMALATNIPWVQQARLSNKNAGHSPQMQCDSTHCILKAAFT